MFLLIYAVMLTLDFLKQEKLQVLFLRPLILMQKLYLVQPLMRSLTIRLLLQLLQQALMPTELLMRSLLKRPMKNLKLRLQRRKRQTMRKDLPASRTLFPILIMTEKRLTSILRFQASLEERKCNKFYKMSSILAALDGFKSSLFYKEG